MEERQRRSGGESARPKPRSGFGPRVKATALSNDFATLFTFRDLEFAPKCKSKRRPQSTRERKVRLSKSADAGRLSTEPAGALRFLTGKLRTRVTTIHTRAYKNKLKGFTDHTISIKPSRSPADDTRDAGCGVIP